MQLRLALLQRGVLPTISPPVFERCQKPIHTLNNTPPNEQARAVNLCRLADLRTILAGAVRKSCRAYYPTLFTGAA